MFHIVLYQPEIPPNTGNIIRLCANTGCELHLIEPLGFSLNDKHLRRAGLDYYEFASVKRYDSLDIFSRQVAPGRLFAFSTKAELPYSKAEYKKGDALVFGPETRGLPADLLESLPINRRLRLPMIEHSRSLNLSNTVAVVVYEAWRQQGFSGGG
ncbi:MAG: tRNA (uridine(34)/cytosine(34)/5-carboxymethylaminomethyluridine(34)-2'-O)-methyltransferase TrmL [Gammaproteobacteria bacterium]|nr:MAG: tRNA (uridine(34)/cytosine(34)/5-carboxymethylaminomethyluridine(34)-2'-O)-methyltransferase TrmL [Gammaproteobacteria bacterium]